MVLKMEGDVEVETMAVWLIGINENSSEEWKTNRNTKKEDYRVANI
jgi:hypothetical protein